MVNTQQITIHMMLFRCSYTVPSNMFIFNSLMSQLTQKDMYPSDMIFDSIFSFTSKPSPIEHFENLGYEGANFVMLSGSLLINICISVVLSIVLHIVDHICTKLYHLKVARYIGSKIVKTNVLGAIITLYLQSFLEMLLCCFISIKEMGHQDFSGENKSDTFAAIFTIASLLIYAFLLIFVTYLGKLSDFFSL